MLYFCQMNNVNYEFSDEKNRKLVEERGIGFKEIIQAIQRGAVLDILPHPNFKKYPNQEIYVIEIDNYVYLVPYIKSDDIIFLKTIFPHRKLTRKYLKRSL